MNTIDVVVKMMLAAIETDLAHDELKRPHLRGVAFENHQPELAQFGQSERFAQARASHALGTVSYTHLTLPTKA